MSIRPNDTTADAWRIQQLALRRLGPEGRIKVAIDLSESVREIQIEGLRARNPDWSRADAVRHIVAVRLGVHLPR